MPNYTFKCKDCKFIYELFSSIKDYDSLDKKCEKCRSSNTHRMYDLDGVTGSVVKSDDQLTVGGLADRNRDRFSEDQKEHIYQQTNAYKDKALIKSSYKDEHQGKKEYKKCISKNIKELSQKNLERKLKGKQNAPKKSR